MGESDITREPSPLDAGLEEAFVAAVAAWMNSASKEFREFGFAQID